MDKPQTFEESWEAFRLANDISQEEFVASGYGFVEKLEHFVELQKWTRIIELEASVLLAINNQRYVETLHSEFKKLAGAEFDKDAAKIKVLEDKNAELESILSNEDTLRIHMNSIGYKHIELLKAKNRELENKLKEALNGNLLKRYNEEKEEAIAKNRELVKKLTDAIKLPGDSRV